MINLAIIVWLNNNLCCYILCSTYSNIKFNYSSPNIHSKILICLLNNTEITLVLCDASLSDY